jgi:hypothetical protein
MASATKNPTWRPWRTGSPQKTVSFADSATSGDTGTDLSTVFCSGPSRPVRKLPTQ